MTEDDPRRREPLELTGTTLRVYRYLYRTGKPCGIHDIQRALGLSSSSVAVYHVKKLSEAGLISEEASSSKRSVNVEKIHDELRDEQTTGYVVDRLMFDGMIRIRKSLIPVQVGYASFFASALVLLLSLFRPAVLSGTYLFAMIIIGVAVGVFIYQAIRIASKNRVL